MNPQQHYQAPQVPQTPQTPLPQHDPSDPNNPYGFIMDSGAQAPKGKFNLPQGNSTMQRGLIFGGGFVGLIVVGLILLSLFSGGGGHSAELLSLAQEQTEIVRIANLAENERTIRDSTTSNLASSTSLTVSTSLNQTLGLIKGKKPNDKELSLKKSAKTDTLLTTAAANNQYDEVYVGTLKTKLKSYQSDVKKLYTGNNSKNEKAVLESAYNGTVILLGENK